MLATSISKISKRIQTRPWDTALMAVLGLIGLGVGLWASVIILDDAMITFRVAENLATGRGFVYNVGERVQVTTAPLYAMILAPGVWLLGSAFRAALVLNIALATFIPMLAYDLGRRLAGWVTGVSGALLLAFAPLLVIAFSMESYLYVALILATMAAYVAGQPRLAGVLAGLTALVRGDGVLLGASMLTYDLVAQRRLRWRLILPAVAIPAGWYAFAMLYYGSPFPATLSAKTAQGQFNWLGLLFLDGLGAYVDDWIRVKDLDTFYLFPVLVGVGLLPVIWAERPWLIMIGRDGLYVIAFVTLTVPAAEWYYAPLMPGIALLSGRGVQLMANGLAKIAPARARWFVTTGVAAALVMVLLWTIIPLTNEIIAENPDWKAQVYPDTGRWIATHTNTSANLATIDIGHLGYWSGRPIIDIVGLAQPDVAAHIAEGDFSYAIRDYEPDLILIGYSWLPEVQSLAWFQETYTPRQYFKFSALNEPLLLFSRRQGVKVQAEPIPAAEVQPLALDFNRQIILTGYYLNQPLTPGGALNLTFLWQATAPIEVDFTVFVQLVGGDNTIKAQADTKPQNGFYATPYWQLGEQILDTHTFPLPLDLPPGRYDIIFGFYEAETGLRLQILDEAGEFVSDHSRIEGIEIQTP